MLKTSRQKPAPWEEAQVRRHRHVGIQQVSYAHFPIPELRNKPRQQGCTDTVPLPVLGAVVDRRGGLAIVHATLSAGLLAACREPALHLSQPGLETKAMRLWPQRRAPPWSLKVPNSGCSWSLKLIPEGPGGAGPPVLFASDCINVLKGDCFYFIPS